MLAADHGHDSGAFIQAITEKRVEPVPFKIILNQLHVVKFLL